MALFDSTEQRLARAVSQLAYCNPFLPERIEHERRALGASFDERTADWNLQAGLREDPPNVARLRQRVEQALGRAHDRLSGSADVADEELILYEDLVLFVLYHRYREGFDRIIGEASEGRAAKQRIAFYDPFIADAERYLVAGGRRLPMLDELAHLFACFFQVRRAFANISYYIIGVSRPAIALRAAVWQSIFTHDMRRYRRILYNRMADYTTLVIGPSGTGKELVARAVGLSRYVPFDPKRQAFAGDFAGAFCPLNLSALSPTLIESELFGHKRGAFTGAVADRDGWLEVCPPLGTVFLDEIGDLDPAIQVKLLRVLHSRTFSRLGETQVRRFDGKIIAATNRDLTRRMRDGRFREDFYYRLCSDVIVTPSLKQRLRDDPQELDRLVRFIAGRVVGEDAPDIADEVRAWVGQHIGRDYDWPGNVRELEQCVRNVLIRKSYQPLGAAVPDGAGSPGPVDRITEAMRAGELTADELLGRYCTLVYSQAGSYEEAARRLGLDRRTVKAKLDEKLLRQLSGDIG